MAPQLPVCPLLEHQLTTEEETETIQLPGHAKHSHSKKELIRAVSEGPGSSGVRCSIRGDILKQWARL